MGITLLSEADAETHFLPARGMFAGLKVAYLDSATQHPIPAGARRAALDYLDARSFSSDHRGTSGVGIEGRVHALFAQLINADRCEIATLPSTIAAEQAIIRALNLQPGDEIVTDELHFPGSFYGFGHLSELGVVVRCVPQREGRIHLGDVEEALTKKTRLVATSWVSGINGFQHDLRKLADLVHDNGALLYVDIIQGVGAIPLDVSDTKVDFAACSSFKWLMGDFGVGLMYVRKELLERLQHPYRGYYQTQSYRLDQVLPSHIGEMTTTDANGVFAMSTLPLIVLAQLEWSLGYILQLGVSKISAHAAPLIGRIRSGLCDLGYFITTPPESTAPIVSCQIGPASRMNAALERASVMAALSGDRLRASVSVFNDETDIERFLVAVASTNRP